MYLTRCPAEVFDVRSGKKLPFNLPHDDGILFASFSPDGTRIVTASEDDTAVIWDARTGKQVTPTLRHHRSVQMARFSPDGKWVVTACFDGSGRIWDVQSGNPITPPLSHMDVLMITQFIGDGGKVLFQDYRGRNWVWTVPDERKPSGDLALIAEVLTGDSVSLSGPDALSIHHDPRKAWSFLHSKYPQDFAVTGQDVEKWHRTQSALCLKDSNTNGSNFHLNFLANTTKP
jgi:WD40 repeat protein